MTNQQDKILVVMPMYNAEKTAEKAIRSVLEQRHKNLTLTIVDDCSTDNSLAIARQFLSDPRVTIYHNTKNMGAYYSRNLGLAVNKDKEWDYFTTHDADDVSFNFRYKKMLSFFVNGVVAVQDSFERVDFLTEKSMGSSMSMAHAMFKRSVFDSIGYFDSSTRFAADWEYWQRLKVYLTKGKYGKLAGCQQVLGKSFVHGENLTVLIPIGSKARTDYADKASANIESMKQPTDFYMSFSKSAGLSKKITTPLKKAPEIMVGKTKSVSVVLLTWKRLTTLRVMLAQLSRQTYEDFDVYISNGNLDKIQAVERIASEFSDRLKIKISHDGNEYYSYRRLFVGKDLAEKGKDIIIFLDDDVSIPFNFIEKALEFYEPKTYQSWYAWQFTTGGKDYFDRIRVSSGQQKVHYGGAGVSMIDSSIFLKKDLFNSPKEARKIEDLWLSFVVSKQKDWKIKYLPIKDVVLGGSDMVALHKEVMSSEYNKTDFLKDLVKKYKWDLSL